MDAFRLPIPPDCLTLTYPSPLGRLPILTAKMPCYGAANGPCGVDSRVCRRRPSWTFQQPCTGIQAPS